jgi:hypothetical protein
MSCISLELTENEAIHSAESVVYKSVLQYRMIVN